VLTRRSVTTRLATIGAFIGSPPLIHAVQAQQSERAVSLVKNTSDGLVGIVNGADPPSEKRLKLQRVIDTNVDVDDLAHFCLGRFKRLATPEQLQQYLVLFDELLVTKIAGHLGEYRGVQVTMGVARAAEDKEIVITTVDRPNSPSYQIDWVVSITSGRPKIVDLLAGGTSLRQTQSSDFAAYLARHQYNIHELLEGMRQLIGQSTT
jgi:phospholipid transport system substrate-binding protein